MGTVGGINQNGYAAYYQNSTAAMDKKRGARQERAAQGAGAREAEYVRGGETQKTDARQVSLSSRAQKLLEKMQKKYGNMDFVVANYSSTGEAQSLMAGSSKEYSAVIEPELLEKMASDEEAYEKYTGILEDAQGQLGNMVKQLGDDAGKVTKMGISLDKEGNASYFAELEKSSEAQRERIEKSRDKKREEAKAEQKKDGEKDPVQRARVASDSVQGLLEKIRAYRFPDRQEQVRPGASFDRNI